MKKIIFPITIFVLLISCAIAFSGPYFNSNDLVNVSSNLQISSAVSATGGGLRRTLAEGTATLSGASTVITLNPFVGGSRIPSGARLSGVQFRVETAITSGVGVSWSAAFNGGSSASIITGQSFTKNTKVNVMLAGATRITTALTDITITPNAGTFTGGVIRAIVYYEDLADLSDAP